MTNQGLEKEDILTALREVGARALALGRTLEQGHRMKERGLV